MSSVPCKRCGAVSESISSRMPGSVSLCLFNRVHVSQQDDQSDQGLVELQFGCEAYNPAVPYLLQPHHCCWDSLVNVRRTNAIL